MLRKIAKLLVGKRNKYEVGYYKKLAYIENKLREFVVGIIMAIVFAVILAALVIANETSSTSTGKYVPDGYDAYGNLVDTDGDGDYHHWVEE
jgi:hypothetical protein